MFHFLWFDIFGSISFPSFIFHFRMSFKNKFQFNVNIYYFSLLKINLLRMF